MVETNWTQPYYNPAEHGFFKADVGGEENNFGYPSDYFFADTMRSVSEAFGQKFSNIVIVREDEKGYPRKHIQVPIKFGPRAKSHDYRTELEAGTIDENGVVEPKYYIQNPCMTWKYTSGNYDGTRQTSSNEIRAFYDKYLLSKGVELTSCDLFWKDTMVIPVNLGIQLTCYADKDADINRMFEMVMRKTKDSAMFLYVKEFWFMNIRRDIKVKLIGFNFDFGKDEMGAEDKRECKVTFDFTCEAFVYRPIEQTHLITSIIATLNPHINYGPILRFGVSGNAHMHEKYMSNSAAYVSAAKLGQFDGSLTSAYDFTKNGFNTVGLASAVASSYDIQFTPEEIAKFADRFPDATNVTGFATKYIYSAIPDTWREFTRDFKVLDTSVYIFGDIATKYIDEYGNPVTGIASGTCLHTYNTYEHPYNTIEADRLHYEYDTKPFEDSKHNVINTIYGTSHNNYYPVDALDPRKKLTLTSADADGKRYEYQIDNPYYMDAPYVTNPEDNYIYLTPLKLTNSATINNDEYQEWIYAPGLSEWRKLGTIKISFANL